MEGRELTYDLSSEGANRQLLTAMLHVSFHFPHPNDWGSGGMGRWKHEFRVQAERAWSHQWELVSNDGVVRVALRIYEVAPGTVAPNRHWWIAVNSPARSEHEWLTRTIYRCRGPLPHSQVRGGGSGLVKVHCNDVDCGWGHGTSPGDALTQQRGTDHEVGHMLGMQHPYCNGGHVDEGDGDSASCYWRPGRHGGRTANSYSMMGLGSRVTRSDYAWAKKLAERVTRRTYVLRQKTHVARPTYCGGA